MSEKRLKDGFSLLSHTLVCLYILVYTQKFFEQPKSMEFVFFIIYVIIGVIVPIFVNKSNLQKMPKAFLEFNILIGVSVGIIIEIITHYIGAYRFDAVESIASKLNFNLFNRFMLNAIFSIILVFYIRRLYMLFKKTMSGSVFILLGTFACAFFSYGDIVRNGILGAFICYFIVTFDNISTSIFLVIANAFANILIIYIHNTYSVYGIMHYFVFLLAVISFITLKKALEKLEPILYYKKLNTIKIKEFTKKDTKAIWFILLMLGVFLVTYYGRS